MSNYTLQIFHNVAVREAQDAKSLLFDNFCSACIARGPIGMRIAIHLNHQLLRKAQNVSIEWPDGGLVPPFQGRKSLFQRPQQPTLRFWRITTELSCAGNGADRLIRVEAHVALILPALRASLPLPQGEGMLRYWHARHSS